MSKKMKKYLILGGFGLSVLMILFGVLAIIAGHNLLYWSEITLEEANFEVIVSGIMLHSCGIIDILVSFFAIFCGILWVILRLKD